jgi:hypothetical protein
MKRVGRALLLLLLACARGALAQGSPEPSLTLQVAANTLHAEWEVRLEDLNQPLQLDTDHDGRITWPEIEHRRQQIEAYLGSHLRFLANGSELKVSFTRLLYGQQAGEPFLLAQLQADSDEEIRKLGVAYSLASDHPTQLAPDHSAGSAPERPSGRYRLSIVWPNGAIERQEIPTDSSRVWTFDHASAHSAFLESLDQGIWHIWTGYDHILFLIVLLIPAVFRRTAHGREAVPTFRDAALRVVIIVSAFTIAHSITLACAALEWIRLPARLVESVIAASIFIAAVNNFLPRTAGGRSAWLAFGFGLIHGFGFAGALSELGAGSAGPLWQTLLAFNLGVEVGQLAIVGVFLPIAYLLRQTRFYRAGVLYGGSSLACLCALVWFWQRAFGGSI